MQFADTQISGQFATRRMNEQALGWQNSATTTRGRQALKAHPRNAPAAEPNTLDRETFGKRLRTARKAFGWTLSQLSELSGVSITTISRAERGQLALGYKIVRPKEVEQTAFTDIVNEVEQATSLTAYRASAPTS